MLVYYSRRYRRPELAPLVIMSVSQMVLLFIVAPIPDGRYALFVLIAGQICLIGKTVESISGLNARRKTKKEH